MGFFLLFFESDLCPQLSQQKNASCIAISVLLIGCGGGGGGSGANNPGTPGVISTQPTVITPIIGTVINPDKSTTPVITPKPVKPQKPGAFNTDDPFKVKQAHANGLTGKGVKVGIVDGDFNSSHSELAGLTEKTFYQNGGKGNGSQHGAVVAEILGGRTSGVAPQVEMIGAAAGVDEPQKRSMLTRKMFADLAAKDVRIVNISLGSGDISTKPKDTTEKWSYVGMPNTGEDLLFVFATGNSNQANPTVNAGLPYWSPELEERWLAVTSVNAIDGMYGKAGEFAEGVNRCGVAQNWCLAAPGDFQSKVAGKRMDGTSFAAPAVSAAAALVQQAYPWMNASTLRQTILSTATRQEDRNTYGWGVLDASKAVKGPSLFDKKLTLAGDFIADLGSDDNAYTFSNDIAGNAGLFKDGNGSLTLSGANTYTGENHVQYGELNITGSVRAGVTVASFATLRADNGKIGGNVQNSGTMTVAGKGMTIAGNYAVDAGATLNKHIGAPLTIGGTATLDESSLIMHPRTGQAASFVTAQGTKDTILQANGGVIGTFEDASFAGKDSNIALLNTGFEYTKNQVDLTIQRKNMRDMAEQSFGGDATRMNSAENLEQAMQVADTLATAGNTEGTQATFMRAAAELQNTTTANVADVIDSLSGQIHGSAQALTFQQSQAVNRDLSNRLAQFGNNTGSTAKHGLWTSVIGSSGKLAQDGFAGANTSLAGGQFGVDTHLNEKTVIGAALAYSDSTAHFNRFGGQSKSQSVGVSVYGRHAFEVGSTDVYVSGRGGIATVNSRVNRSVMMGSTTDTLDARHNDKVLSAYLETGFDQALSGNISMTPFAGVSYDRVNRGSFTESGSAFGLTAKNQSYQQVASTLGLRANSTFTSFAGKSYVQMYAAWQHAFGSGKLDFDANYTGAPTTGFQVKGIGMARNTGWVGIGIATDITKRLGWFANYDAQFGQAGKLNNVVSAGIRLHLD
ncbi:autotransporter serine protease [Glaciimonas sp. PCH181]|uniref:autotransporter serine protease n=1 Tax=Glaciimonas sp. PCH181 TaxID=2133943 RepID=UPI000D3CCDAE|nr:autotransporter serine protease [Glaciimonas sp. PCH181]PUA19994.1 peptidase S8 [Glaciimonas sp. PCH181]